MAPAGTKARVTNPSWSEVISNNKKAVNRLPKNGSKNGGKPEAPKEEGRTFVIPRLELTKIRVAIIGTSPLIVNRMSRTKMMEIEKNQGEDKTKVAPRKRAPRVPEVEYVNAAYINREGKFCLRTLAVKSAMVQSVRFLPGNAMGKVFPQATAKGVLQVLGELTPMICPPPTMRRDQVRLESGVTSLAYRPEFFPWGAWMTIQFNPAMISHEGVFGLLQRAGFHSGISEWRPERGGNYGMFQIGDENSIAELEEAVEEATKLAEPFPFHLHEDSFLHKFSKIPLNERKTYQPEVELVTEPVSNETK